MAQWLRIYWPMQGTRVQSLVQEDSTSAAREATAIRSPRTATKSSPRSPQLEKAHVQQQKPNTAKKLIKKKKKLNKKKIGPHFGVDHIYHSNMNTTLLGILVTNNEFFKKIY